MRVTIQSGLTIVTCIEIETKNNDEHCSVLSIVHTYEGASILLNIVQITMITEN